MARYAAAWSANVLDASLSGSTARWSSGILGQKEGLPIQDHSMYFAVELCILLRNYVYVAAELHFHIVAGARRALVLNGNWS